MRDNTKEIKKGTKKILFIVILFIVFLFNIGIAKEVNATNTEKLTNTTRVYFCSEITKTYGNGDCILLENYDANGNKIYGLIDTGRNLAKNDTNGNASTVVKEFLKKHGVERLEFMAITHSHSDHNGDALTVLDNFEVNRIYIKEFDKNWSPSGTQNIYEDIIEKAVAKNIKVIGVSYLSLTSNEISPSRTSEFIKNTRNAKPELFESFYYNNIEDTNIIFPFGSAKVQVFNWEMFDEEGNQYITGVTNGATREIDENENNNSIAFLLTQGNKRAFFAGDMNNLDEDEAKGRIGDEDRLKQAIGDVDLLKLGHHGYKYSNTEDYINVLRPEYAIITNDIDGACEDTKKWLKANHVNYLYTTSDENAISATITNNDVYLGFETTGSFQSIDGTIYYIPEGEQYQYPDYTKNSYQLQYIEKNVEVNSWNQLEEAIESNKREMVSIDHTNKICTLYKLIVHLKAGGDWTATNAITIEKQQKITLTTSENITMLRGTELKKLPLFLINGSFDIGTKNMVGNITLDGNKEKVEAASSLVKIESGIFNLYDHVTLCNNLNKATNRTINSTTQDYTSFGSAIYCNKGTINMYGGNIINNNQDVVYTHTLPREITNNYRYSALGTGIYMFNHSTFNMYDGKISYNKAENHSVVQTSTSYTNDTKQRSIDQRCEGVGIYAYTNSEVNLLGGEISENSANNYASTTLLTASDKTKNTNIYTLNDGIYGVGIYVVSSKLKISNDFVISNNTANLNSKITLEKDTEVKNLVNSGIRGLQGYIKNTDVTIDGAIVTGGNSVNNTQVINHGKIGEKGTDSASITDVGGGLDFINNTIFHINRLTVDNCNSGNGGGIYIQSSSGTISNSNITNNKATMHGGGIWTYLGNIKIENTTLSGNTASYGRRYLYLWNQI